MGSGWGHSNKSRASRHIAGNEHEVPGPPCRRTPVNRHQPEPCLMGSAKVHVGQKNRESRAT